MGNIMRDSRNWVSITIGNSLMVIYAIATTLGQIAALVFSIDAPLKSLTG